MKKLAIALLSFSLFAPALLVGNTSDFAMAKADNENSVYLECGDNLVEGSSYYAHVKLRSHEQIEAFFVEVHFDGNVVTVNSTYNSMANSQFSSAIHEDYVSFSYLFDSLDTENPQELFYFSFSVNSPVVAGSSYFDVVVTEAYGPSLESVEVNGSRKNFNVANKVTPKSAYANLNKSSVTTSVTGEFNFTYSINSLVPESGAFVIYYDDQLFEFVSINMGSFFNNMFVDYNASGAGTVYVTFAAATPTTSYSLFTITLRTIANVTQSSTITLGASELYDSDLQPMSFSASSLKVNVEYDQSYEENPKMGTSYSVDYENHRITLDIALEADSHLGAGDFTLTFDRNLVTYVSHTKNFTPTFFTVNDKETQLSQGKVKYSIISTTDIVEAVDVISFVFAYEESKSDQQVDFGLSGSGLTNAATEAIELDVSGTSLTIPGVDFIIRWSKAYLFMDDPSFAGEGEGLCRSQGLYVTAKTELQSLDEESINDFKNNDGEKYTAELARYLAWAAACGDTKPFEGSGIVPAGSLAVIGIGQNVSWALVAIVAIALVSISLSAFVLKKRKERN